MPKKLKRLVALLGDKFWRAKQRYPDYYEKLPLDERAILLESEHGKRLDGNIFYIIKYLSESEKYSGYKIYYSSMGRYMRKFRAMLARHGIKNAECVMLASDGYFRLLASAKYLINDTSFGPYFIKKRGQVYLNTWHGTPLKTLGKSDADGYHTLSNVQKNFIKSDFLLFPNEYTREAMTRDYMLENLHRGSAVISGYPRNEIFFDPSVRERVCRKCALGNKRVYAYMPTYRGSVGRGGTRMSEVYLNYHLAELDRRLTDGEVLFVKLHPLAKDSADLSHFKRIRSFPEGFEVYEFLTSADVLVTDYSSVLFDFAVSGRKTVLFAYDEEEYLATRGTYISLDSLPFPKVADIGSLLSELRSEKNYSDAEFLRKFSPYDGVGATARLCDAVILGERGDIRIEPTKSNGRENVVIYAGNLAKNGITTSLLSLLNTVDTEKRNYYITYKSEKISGSRGVLKALPEGVGYIGTAGDIAITLRERCVRWLFKKKLLTAGVYAALCERALRRGFEQYYGDARIDSVIQFNGYESEMLLLFSTYRGCSTVFVHNDMEKEIRTKKNQRRDVLRYVYRRYTTVAAVTEDMTEPTFRISGRRDNIKIVKNAINYKSVKEKAKAPIPRRPYERCSVSRETLSAILSSETKKFINIGRFSPEKSHGRLVRAFEEFLEDGGDAYLLIIGGYDSGGYYDRLLSQVEAAGISERVILMLGVANPYNILGKCDGFILSSLYEGFGLVLAEADILGLPVVSTDIDGPRGFMKKYGGTLVENSVDGLVSGLRLLAEGKVAPLSVDYERYNAEVRDEFEALFGRDGV